VKIRFLILVNGNLQILATAPEGNVAVPPRLVPGDFDWRRSRLRRQWMLTPTTAAPALLHARLAARDGHVMRNWREAGIQVRAHDVEARLRTIVPRLTPVRTMAPANPPASTPAPAAAPASASVVAADAAPHILARKVKAAKLRDAIRAAAARLQAAGELPPDLMIGERNRRINAQLSSPVSVSTLRRALKKPD
jgi:hypothetical protein